VDVTLSLGGETSGGAGKVQKNLTYNEMALRTGKTYYDHKKRKPGLINYQGENGRLGTQKFFGKRKLVGRCHNTKTNSLLGVQTRVWTNAEY